MLGVLRDAGGSSDNALARRWQWAISLWKNQGLDGDAARRAPRRTTTSRWRRASCARYEQRLAAFQAVDFDDLIGLPLKLLQRACRRARRVAGAASTTCWSTKYQDTNAVQYDLLKALVEPSAARLFTAVGDDDQSIYGWRGATIENLKRLPQDFPKLKLIALEQNYRSTGAHPARRQPCHRRQPEVVREEAVERARRRRAGARARMRRRRTRGRTRGGAHPVACRSQRRRSQVRDFAVLYRANHQARVFEQKLRAAQIPYKVSGGQSFFDRAEIKDLCAWLRLLVNQDDDPAFLRAVTSPKRGIGAPDAGQPGRVCRHVEGQPVRGAVLADAWPRPSAKAVGSLHEFGRYVNELEHRARHTPAATMRGRCCSTG